MWTRIPQPVCLILVSFMWLMVNMMWNTDTIEFDGCGYGPDPNWGIVWPNTPRSTTNSQRCPGGLESLGMMHLKDYCNFFTQSKCCVLLFSDSHTLSLDTKSSCNRLPCMILTSCFFQGVLLVIVMRMEYGLHQISCFANQCNSLTYLLRLM